MNLKNAKEVKEKVEEIKKKRTKSEKICTKNEKNVQKTSNKALKNKNAVQKKSKKQKENKKKFRKFLFKVFALEYMTAGAILLWAFGTTLIQTNEKLVAQINEQQIIMKNLAEQVTEIRIKPAAAQTIVEEVAEERIYLGNFKITHYCACKKCCGPNAQGITASGKRVQAGKTIAVDPSVIKLGNKVYIDGYGYMEAQDTGSAIKGNIIDVYVEDHQEALEMGVQYKDVYLIK